MTWKMPAASPSAVPLGNWRSGDRVKSLRSGVVGEFQLIAHVDWCPWCCHWFSDKWGSHAADVHSLLSPQMLLGLWHSGPFFPPLGRRLRFRQCSLPETVVWRFLQSGTRTWDLCHTGDPLSACPAGQWPSDRFYFSIAQRRGEPLIMWWLSRWQSNRAVVQYCAALRQSSPGLVPPSFLDVPLLPVFPVFQG